MTCPQPTDSGCSDMTPCRGCRKAARWDDPNLALPWCIGCPDREACGQGACYINGGPNRPVSDPPGAVTLPAPTPGGDQR